MTYQSRKRSGLLKSAPHVLLLLLLFSRFSLAQVAFDVKTTMEEKSQLHVIKIAVINSLQQSNWATVKEVGEDYSLWLTNLRRSSSGDSITTVIDFDLRTPAMLTRGKHLDARRVSISFDTTGVSSVQASNDSLINGLLVQGLQSSGLLEEFTKLFASSIPFGSFFVNSFASKVLKELNRQPTPLESLEANLVAAKAVVALQLLIAERSQKK